MHDSNQCRVFHLSLSCLSTPSMLRSFQRGVGLFCIINIAISTTLSPAHAHTQTHSIEDSWHQARASIKPVWVWEPFKGHFASDLQSSILLTTAPWWPSGWPWGRRHRGREKWRGGKRKWTGKSGTERKREMEKLWMKVRYTERLSWGGEGDKCQERIRCS